ncbi:casein kinase I [Nucleospora cyclopteri]
MRVHTSIMNNSYRVMKKLGGGAFGTVYEVIVLNDQTTVKREPDRKALKIPSTRKKSKLYLNREIKTLQDIKYSKYWSKLHNYQMDTFILIDKYETTLFDMMSASMKVVNVSVKQQILEKSKNLTNEKFICEILMSLINALEMLHKAGYIYKDLKPENIMFNKSGNLKLIDFGMCEKIVGNTIIDDEFSYYYQNFFRKKEKYIVGTLRYCSMNCHRGEQLSFLDDLENLIYVIIYVYEGTLPWNSEEKQKHISEKIDTIFNDEKFNLNIKNINILKSKQICATQKFSLTKNIKLEKIYRYIIDLQNKKSNLEKVLKIPYFYNSTVYTNIKKIINENNREFLNNSYWNRFLNLFQCFFCR